MTYGMVSTQHRHGVCNISVHIYLYLGYYDGIKINKWTNEWTNKWIVDVEYNDTPNQCRQILNTTLVRFKAQYWSSQWIQQQWIQINKYTNLQIGQANLCEFSHVQKLCDQMRKSWFLCNFSVSISFSLSNINSL